MTKEEYNEAAALVVRLRKELEHTNQHLVAHIDALTKSNAQCGEYLRHNEMLAADRATLHKELVEVRAALAATTEQRDSLQRTLDEWSNADTKPHERIILQPVPDDREFRNGVPTPEMLKVCSWWEVHGRADVICFKNNDQRPVVWRSLRGDASWQYEDCPQPLKPSKRTWKALDALLSEATADVADHVVPPVLPMCTTCHGCGGPIIYGTVVGSPSVLHCRNEHCLRRNTAWRDDISPYHGPCKSSTPVRHE